MSKIDRKIRAALSSSFPLEPLCELAVQLQKEGLSQEEVDDTFTKAATEQQAENSRYLLEAAEYVRGKCIQGDCDNGFGVVQWASGDVYVGNWKDGKQDGHGTYVSAADAEGVVAVYAGQFRNGVKEGHGTNIAYPSVYVGEFENDQHSGHGQLTWSNGGKYVGRFHRAERHGPGTMYYPDGKVEYQRWICGKLKDYDEKSE